MTKHNKMLNEARHVTCNMWNTTVKRSTAHLLSITDTL